MYLPSRQLIRVDNVFGPVKPRSKPDGLQLDRLYRRCKTDVISPLVTLHFEEKSNPSIPLLAWLLRHLTLVLAAQIESFSGYSTVLSAKSLNSAACRCYCYALCGGQEGAVKKIGCAATTG